MKNSIKLIFIALFFVTACNYSKNDISDYSTTESTSKTTTEETATTADATLKAGDAIYKKTCLACHQAEGQGVEGAFPPLAASDYLNADIDRAIKGLIHGQSGEMIVNGKSYNSAMPPQNLNDEEIAQVLTYVLNSWDNSGGTITAEQVAKHR